MRWRWIVASLLLLVVLAVTDARARKKSRQQENRPPRKRKQERRVGSEPTENLTALTQDFIPVIPWRDEKQQHKEDTLKRKAEIRRKRRKQRKRKLKIQRKAVEEKRREEEEALRLQLEKEEEWRRQWEEEEEQRRGWEAEAGGSVLRVEGEQGGQDEIQRTNEVGRNGEMEEEEGFSLRGEEYHMMANEPIPGPLAGEDEQEEEEVDLSLQDRDTMPPGCTMSDVILSCENAKLSYFPPLAIPELKSLSLEGNNISSIPAGAFNGIPNLEWVNLKKNKLTSTNIDATAFSPLIMLRRLYLDGNALEAVPSNLPSSLQELKINENKIRSLKENSFQDLNSLVILELEGNLLSEGDVDHMAFFPLTQLSYLRLGRNNFRTVPQGLPSTLLELYLENNVIEEISDTVFNQTLDLNVVSLRYNRLDETRIAPMAWINHRNLESIDLSHNDFYLVPSYLPKSLVHLVLMGNKIERIPGYVFAHMDPGIEYLYLSYNRVDGEGIEPESFFGSYNSMIELCLDHNQLVTVPAGINEMTTLHFLTLNNNMISGIPADGFCDVKQSMDSTLITLRIENNYIDLDKISPATFSCVLSSSRMVLKPQKSKDENL